MVMSKFWVFTQFSCTSLNGCCPTLIRTWQDRLAIWSQISHTVDLISSFLLSARILYTSSVPFGKTASGQGVAVHCAQQGPHLEPSPTLSMKENGLDNVYKVLDLRFFPFPLHWAGGRPNLYWSGNLCLHHLSFFVLSKSAFTLAYLVT